MYIQPNDIFEKTNGGLDIILTYYPQASEAIENKKGFKLRKEKTASTHLKETADGNWLVTDFGSDQQPRNAIQICMQEENITFREALVLLADRYSVGGIKSEINKPGFEQRQAKTEEKEGEYFFEYKGSISDKELEILGPKVTEEVCAKYNVFALESFTYIKNRKAHTTIATENYPILVFHGDENLKKIYQPLNPNKAFRFRYVGKKTKDFIFGMLQLQQAYEEYKDQQKRDKADEDTHDIEKIPEVIIGSGERDCLNIAGYGYAVVWLNSETAILTDQQMKKLKSYAENVYILPDIDTTGKKAAIRQGLTHLNLKIIWLPESLRKYNDRRGNPRKDFRDYIELYKAPKDFKKLIRVAMPLQFWDESVSDKGIKYYFNNEQAYAFLAANGFYRLEDKNSKEGFVFIVIEKNQVREVKANEIKSFVLNFLKSRHLPIPLRNMIHKTNQLSEAALTGLPMTKLDFTDYDDDVQFFFFQNKTWEAKAGKIIEHRPEEINRFVWQEEIIDKNVKLLDEPFEIKFNKNTEYYEINIKDNSSLFFRYLINTSRTHWQKELETEIDKLSETEQLRYLEKNRFEIAGPLLSEAEQTEQKQHLVNKMFAVGYLLHRYKNPSRPWAVFAMDNKISETGESHGRSGKSIAFKAPRLFMKSVTLNGRNPKLTENQHIYDRVTEHTDYILVDDCNQYLNFDFFFSELTGEMVVNPKNSKSYEIPFDKVPKFAFTSNFTLRNIDPSTEGRLLYTVFSDYYHIQGSSTEYRENRDPASEMGKNLFGKDYTEANWNADYNFFARCVAFYLSVNEKINPPMGNVTLRNLRTEMTEPFKDWADSYFVDKLDIPLSKSELMEEFARATNMRRWTPNRFLKSLKAWCKFKGNYILNPNVLCNNGNRIMKKIDGKTIEHYYIQTTDDLNPETLTDENQFKDAPF